MSNCLKKLNEEKRKIESKIKLYKSFIKIRISNEIQYKGAAIAGVVTQFAWGFMYIFLYTAFLKNGTSTDYTVHQMCTYIWMQQAFLRLFNLWSTGLDEEVLDECQKGDICMELIRPVNLYYIWHAKTFGKKIASVLLRAIPIFIICGLPIFGDYRMIMPISISAFIYFIITLILSAFILMAYTMLLYIAMMKAMTSRGITITFQLIMELCSGSLLPLAFMPDKIINILKFTPFYYMQHVTFNIYSGYISNQSEIIRIILLQIVWLMILTALGKKGMNNQLKKIIVQGG